MLVLANGAYKSGSSWLLAIVKELAPFEEVPDEFRSPFHKQAWIDGPRLRAFLESRCYHSRDIVSKGHFYGDHARRLLLGYADVFVLDIERDIKDSVVSHYYHVKRDRKLRWTFAEYYRRLGRFKAAQIMAYHATWRRPAPNLYMSSYERLRQDFATEVTNIAAFLGIEVTPEHLREVEQRTSLRSMQAARGQDALPESERFFRKGIVGDWKNHFDAAMLADLDRIRTHGLGPLGTTAYRVIFDVRPVLSATYRRLAKPIVGATRR